MSSMRYEVLKEIRRILIFVFLRSYSLYQADTCQNFGTTSTSTSYTKINVGTYLQNDMTLRQTLYL
jgi:hypothetical protein